MNTSTNVKDYNYISVFKKLKVNTPSLGDKKTKGNWRKFAENNDININEEIFVTLNAEMCFDTFVLAIDDSKPNNEYFSKNYNKLEKYPDFAKLITGEMDKIILIIQKGAGGFLENDLNNLIKNLEKYKTAIGCYMNILKIDDNFTNPNPTSLRLKMMEENISMFIDILNHKVDAKQLLDKTCEKLYFIEKEYKGLIGGIYKDYSLIKQEKDLLKKQLGLLCIFFQKKNIPLPIEYKKIITNHKSSGIELNILFSNNKNSITTPPLSFQKKLFYKQKLKKHLEDQDYDAIYELVKKDSSILFGFPFKYRSSFLNIKYNKMRGNLASQLLRIYSKTKSKESRIILSMRQVDRQKFFSNKNEKDFSLFNYDDFLNEIHFGLTDLVIKNRFELVNSFQNLLFSIYLSNNISESQRNDLVRLIYNWIDSQKTTSIFKEKNLNENNLIRQGRDKFSYYLKGYVRGGEFPNYWGTLTFSSIRNIFNDTKNFFVEAVKKGNQGEDINTDESKDEYNNVNAVFNKISKMMLNKLNSFNDIIDFITKVHKDKSTSNLLFHAFTMKTLVKNNEQGYFLLDKMLKKFNDKDQMTKILDIFGDIICNNAFNITAVKSIVDDYKINNIDEQNLKKKFVENIPNNPTDILLYIQIHMALSRKKSQHKPILKFISELVMRSKIDKNSVLNKLNEQNLSQLNSIPKATISMLVSVPVFYGLSLTVPFLMPYGIFMAIEGLYFFIRDLAYDYSKDNYKSKQAKSIYDLAEKIIDDDSSKKIKSRNVHYLSELSTKFQSNNNRFKDNEIHDVLTDNLLFSKEQITYHENKIKELSKDMNEDEYHGKVNEIIKEIVLNSPDKYTQQESIFRLIGICYCAKTNNPKKLRMLKYIADLLSIEKIVNKIREENDFPSKQGYFIPRLLSYSVSKVAWRLPILGYFSYITGPATDYLSSSLMNLTYIQKKLKNGNTKSFQQINDFCKNCILGINSVESSNSSILMNL